MLLNYKEKLSFDKRMSIDHVFVLMAPKRCPIIQDIMPTQEYEIHRINITVTLRKYKEYLFEVFPKVVLCSPAEQYAYKVHQYLSRLICWTCSPRYDTWTLQLKELHIGGCNDQPNEFWPEIQKITANVEPHFRRWIRKNLRWLKN